MMFHPSTQSLRERLRGFEMELDELDEVIRLQVDEKTEQDLNRLLPEALKIFEGRLDASAYERLVHLVVGLHLDPEKLIPLLSARVFEHGEAHNHNVIEHLLRAQNTADPHRRARLMEMQKRERALAWQRVFHDTGLDGAGLMKLLSLKPGPEFGKRLREVQAWVRGEGEAPELDRNVMAELLSRKARARARIPTPTPTP